MKVCMVLGPEWLHLAVYCLGKFGATSAFILIYVIASEVFPTSLRHTTMGVCSMIGRLGSVASPQIPLLVSSSFVAFTSILMFAFHRVTYGSLYL